LTGDAGHRADRSELTGLAFDVKQVPDTRQAATLALMSRSGRLALIVAAPPAYGSPQPVVSHQGLSSEAKFLGSEGRDNTTGDVVVGDPGPERTPRLLWRESDLTVTRDSPAESVTARVAERDVPVEQTGELTYALDLSDGLTGPAMLELEIVSTEGDWTTRSRWGLELADHATVDIKLSGWANSLTASLGRRALSPVKVDDLTYTVALPADLALPAKLYVELDYSGALYAAQGSWIADLAALPVAPAPATTTTTTTAVIRDARATLSALRLKGRRLSVTVACAGTCAGVLTLKTPSRRIARLAIAGPGTYTTTIGAPAQRHLRRNKVKRLRAVVTTRGQAPRALSLRLR
jgi:hypothetical protein